LVPPISIPINASTQFGVFLFGILLGFGVWNLEFGIS
jgi:hypothetical protein